MGMGDATRRPVHVTDLSLLYKNVPKRQEYTWKARVSKKCCRESTERRAQQKKSGACLKGETLGSAHAGDVDAVICYCHPSLTSLNSNADGCCRQNWNTASIHCTTVNPPQAPRRV